MLRKITYSLLAAIFLAGTAYGAGEKLNANERAASGVVARPMQGEAAKVRDSIDSTIMRSTKPKWPSNKETMEIHGRYTVTLLDRNGNVKWSESFDNLVTTVGKNKMLDETLAGSSWTTGTVYMMLKGAGSAAAGDTMSSHAGWSELNISASSGERQSVTFAAASSGSKATSSAVSWSITGSGTVAGVAIVIGGTSTNGNTTGTLFSAGDFSASRSVINGDTLNVTYSASL
jgi:hypothetical protein